MILHQLSMENTLLLSEGLLSEDLLQGLFNELKSAHPNENIYIITIVDIALRNYHEYVFKDKGLLILLYEHL